MRKKRMLLRVERRHIKAGKPGDTGGCAIALAVREMMPDLTFLLVDTLGIWIDGHCHTPKGLAAFIKAFDRGEAVKPCAFEIAV